MHARSGNDRRALFPNGFWNEGNNALPERRLTVLEDVDEFGRNPNLALNEAPLAQARAVARLIVG